MHARINEFFTSRADRTKGGHTLRDTLYALTKRKIGVRDRKQKRSTKRYKVSKVAKQHVVSNMNNTTEQSKSSMSFAKQNDTTPCIAPKQVELSKKLKQ